jgi:2-methylisocitrate lyase-like PEP mutase family enzyme
MNRGALAAALDAERPLVTPLAHDALSARLIERAGFGAFAIGGSAMLAARHALPDIGLAGLGEMAAGIADIAAATTLPFLADGDDGYGDVKSVARTVESYERLGVGGIIIEDQRRERKQPRAEGAKGVIDLTDMAQKLRAAMAARRSAGTLIVGRTDAFGALGLDAAIDRAKAFADLGVDMLFVAGLNRAEHYERVARELAGARLSAAIFEGVGTPWLTPAELGAMGYRHVSFPATLVFRVVATMRETLSALRAHATGKAPMQPAVDAAGSRRTLDDALDLARWQRIEAALPPPASP